MKINWLTILLYIAFIIIVNWMVIVYVELKQESTECYADPLPYAVKKMNISCSCTAIAPNQYGRYYSFNINPEGITPGGIK